MALLPSKPSPSGDALFPGWRATLPVLLPLVLLLGPGLYALDFGIHWDEPRAWIEPLARAYEEGTLLPGRYNYPTFGHYLALLATLPDAVASALAGVDVGESVAAKVRSPEFPLRLRAVFLGVSSLSVLWLYGLVHLWRGSWKEALLASSLLATSWEVSYHARWVATDALVMQFGALVALCSVGAALATRRRGARLVAAAVAAGLAGGTKYPGGLFLATVCCAWLIVHGPGLRVGMWRAPARSLAAVLIAFGVTFVATTPGSVLEFAAFKSGIEYERYHYMEAGHGIYTVEAGAQHLARILEYLGGHLLSPFAPAAWALAALALVGLAATARERPALAVLLALFPVLYVAYVSTSVILAVRNLLGLSPILALFAARGFFVLWAHARPSLVRTSLTLAAVAAVSANGAYSAWAAERTAHRSLERTVAETAEHLARHGQARFGLAPRVRAELARAGALADLANVTHPTDPAATHLVAFPHECRSAYDTWTVGPLDLVEFGPKGVHFEYYPSAHCNGERILVLPMATARRVGLRPDALGPALPESERIVRTSR